MTTTGGTVDPTEHEAVAPVRWIHGAPVAAELGLDRVEADDEAGVGERPAGRGLAAATTSEEFGPIEHRALRMLGRRGLSRRELQRKLEAAEYEGDEIARELDRLEAVGLLDDFALAQQLVVMLQERKGLGRAGIAAELARRVVAPAAIAYALDLVDDGEELARARELAEKRARSLAGLDPVVAHRRLSAYLMRRGFSGTAVRAAIESLRTA